MNILVGLCGSIGILGIHSYLIRLTAEPGTYVRAIMTSTAARIVSPQAIGAVLQGAVIVDLWQEDKANAPTSLLEAIDVLLVAPATATTIALCATGMALNSVSACYLAHSGLTVFAPCMSPEMLAHPATQRNLHALMSDGAQVLGTSEGFQVATGRWSDGALCDYEQMRKAIFGDTSRPPT